MCSDRREAALRLTADGHCVYRRLVPVVLGYQDHLLGSLTEGERKTLERLLDKLERRLELPCRPIRPVVRAITAEAKWSGKFLSALTWDEENNTSEFGICFPYEVNSDVFADGFE